VLIRQRDLWSPRLFLQVFNQEGRAWEASSNAVPYRQTDAQTFVFYPFGFSRQNSSGLLVILALSLYDFSIPTMLHKHVYVDGDSVVVIRTTHYSHQCVKPSAQRKSRIACRQAASEKHAKNEFCSYIATINAVP
jgi:hypothetical protein